MKPLSYHLLRVGMAVTFLWISVLIFRDPVGWGTFIRPWAAKLLPVPAAQVMLGTSVLDGLIGVLLLVDVLSWAAAGVAACHLVVVLITAGINAVTVRDIGLLASCLSLAAMAWPEKLRIVKKSRPPS